MILTAKDINSIAQDLECGMKVFINKDTLAIRTVLDWDEMTDPELWEDELKEVENEWDNYVIIEKLESGEAFSIMESFIDEVDDEESRREIIRILNQRRPFANFKHAVENSMYRQKWFDFRTKCHEEHVRRELDAARIPHE